MIAVVLTAVLALVSRAFRWGAYFLPEQQIPIGPLFGTLSISYMASTFLPFRAGELVRAVFLGSREKVPVPRVVGTILLEKLFDFLALAVMLCLLLATTPLPPAAMLAGGSIATAILAGFGFVVALAVWRGPTLRLVQSVERLVPFGLGERLQVAQAAGHFAAGTDSLRLSRVWALALLWSAATWATSLVTTWSGGAALGITLTLAQVTFLTVLTSAGQAVPSSPGYVGVYHAAAVLALTTLGVGTAEALGVAVLTHALTYGTLVATGLIALWVGGYGASAVFAAVRLRTPTPSSSGLAG